MPARTSLSICTGQGLSNFGKNRRQVFKHPLIPEPHHSESDSAQSSIAFRVPLLLCIVNAAIHFDDKPFSQGAEIHDEAVNHVLPAESCTQTRISQCLPENLFGTRRRPTHATRLRMQSAPKVWRRRMPLINQVFPLTREFRPCVPLSRGRGDARRSRAGVRSPHYLVFGHCVGSLWGLMGGCAQVPECHGVPAQMAGAPPLLTSTPRPA